MCAFAGDKYAAERVASRLRVHVEDPDDKSDALLFWRFKDELIAEARALDVVASRLAQY